MITQKEVTIRIHAELRTNACGSVETYVMTGKRCIQQRSHRNEPEGRAWLADEWGLEPRKVKR